MKRSKAEGRNNNIQNQFVNTQVSETASVLINFFQRYGYKLVQSGPLVAGHEFNGGL
ncbi:hypothetical protein MITS9509_01140 [Synechococcus sp. MIT S9509]|nr:hypothetical protein MITS9509_01140 [Synechococcus sp. MIT S9509]